jgi:hypothetical protein
VDTISDLATHPRVNSFFAIGMRRLGSARNENTGRRVRFHGS